MNASAHILVVDDEPDIVEVLRRYLATQGYTVSTATDGSAMRRVMAATPVDLVLLDLGLPGEDGLALMRSLRDESSAAVVVVTGRGETVDRIVGLEVGADDYIAKPFDVREVGARVRSVLRRTLDRNPRSASAGQSDVVRFAGWTLDLGARRLESPRGAEVELTTGEFGLLAALSGHRAACFRAMSSWKRRVTARPGRSIARSMFRSAACAARSKPIRSIPSSSSRCGARATCSRRRSSADESTPSGGAAALR